MLDLPAAGCLGSDRAAEGIQANLKKLAADFYGPQRKS
jgi:hypothetical protein